MKKSNNSKSLAKFFAFLAIPATALLLTACFDEENVGSELSGEIVTETIPDTKRGMIIDDDTKTLTLVDGVVVTDFLSIKPDDIASITILKGEKATDYDARGGNGVVLVTTKKGVKPLYLIDGVEAPNIDNINNINPSEIESISILKNELATNLYGEKAKNGVVIIKMKKEAN